MPAVDARGPASSSRIRERLERLSALHGLRVRPGMTVSPQGRIALDHALLPTSLRDRALDPDKGDLDQEIEAVVRRLARIQMRDDALGNPVDRWRPPDWATIAHPLTALAIRIRPEGTRATTSVQGDMVVGSCAVAFTPTYFAVTADGHSPTTVTMTAHVPETLALMCAGRPLHDVVDLPICGDDRVDQAVRTLHCEHAQRLGASTGPDGSGPPRLVVTLGPARWIAPVTPPPGRSAPWNDAHPHHA